MGKIHVMDEILANKIAAGEVVERCSSVVKELVENSIDANATEIKIELIEAGTKEIKVTDNGNGMAKEDAVLAFQRHATSKILDEDDLFHIQTLGFRGEALPSIASVSEVTLKTSMGEVGTYVEINGGHLEKVENGDARKGTVMCVKNLFYNTPARLKHMKSLYTELASITDYVNKIALSHPNIKFILVNNGNVLLNTDGSSNLLKTIRNIYGLDVVKKMIEVSAEDEDYLVSGYITYPEVHRSSRNGMITLVNGRVVRDMELNRVINDSYHSYKPDNRYPIVILNIDVDPSLIDVNIHPTKMDIKFSKLEELSSLIENMIKKALKSRTLIPEVDQVDTSYTPLFVEKPTYEEQKLDLNRVMEESVPYQKEQLSLEKEKEDVKKETFEKIEASIKQEEPKEAEKRLPELYPVGLVHGTYIVCQNEEGMYLIDQHAAKERVNYEHYMEVFGNPTEGSIPLLFPLTLEVSNNEFIILKEHLDLLQNLHFVIEEFGINSLIVKEHPTWIPKGQEEEAIKRILEVIVACEKNFSVAKFNEAAATMLSCKMAIKANMNITMEEMEHLINDLRKCKNPFNCPHGRPTIIFYSNYDLEKLFKRSGF